MPSNTTRAGLPYPLGTDPVSDGDDAIRNLANRLDGSGGALASVPYAVAAGTIGVNLAGVAQGQSTVTFPVGRFSLGPRVTFGILLGSTTVAVVRTGGTMGAASFTCVVNTTAAVSQNFQVMWQAVQMTSISAEG